MTRQTIGISAIAVLSVLGCSSTQTGTGYVETGIASYYATKFHGRKTASGERYDQNTMTAAHKRLPFGTRVRVTNTDNGKSVVVRINDRGPFVRGRIIDLSQKAFSRLGSLRSGLLRVKIEVLR